MSFDKFLKEKVIKIHTAKQRQILRASSFTLSKIENESLDLKLISVNDLGEWTWQIVNTTLKEANYKSDWDKDVQNLAGVYEFFEDDFSDTPVLEITIACLGKKEIEKRLVKLK